jgi:hypothetical protein
MNGSQPNPLVVDYAGGGSLSASRDPWGNHNELYPMDADGINSLVWFLDPAIRALNQAIADLAPAHVYMTGISGGGWTTDLVAAVDTRIEAAYPVFGSMPFGLRTYAAYVDANDYEQSARQKTWAVVTPIEVFALGAFEARRRLHTLGTLEPVFTVTAAKLPRVRDFEARVNTLLDGGRLGSQQVWLDDTTANHEYSSAALAAIWADIQALHPL